MRDLEHWIPEFFVCETSHEVRQLVEAIRNDALEAAAEIAEWYGSGIIPEAIRKLKP